MIEIGRICLKVAGRDAGKLGVIVDIVDDKHVLLEGAVRRRKCNISHLELTEKKADVKKGASREDVLAALQKLGLEFVEKKGDKKEAKPRPKKQKVNKKQSAPAKPAASAEKKETKKTE